MAKKEILFVRNQTIDFGLFDAKKNVSIIDIIHHRHTFSPIFFIRKSTDVAGLNHNLMLRVQTVQLRDLLW